jgi:TRAP-type mannitol/chloroaromatic compound transport system permease small subunit
LDIVKFTRVADGVSDVAGYIAKWLVLLACLVSAGNAVVRYLISYSSNGLLEIQWYMFGGIVLLGAAQTLRLNEHVRVDLLYSWVPRTLMFAVMVVFLLIGFPVAFSLAAIGMFFGFSA